MWSHDSHVTSRSTLADGQESHFFLYHITFIYQYFSYLKFHNPNPSHPLAMKGNVLYYLISLYDRQSHDRFPLIMSLRPGRDRKYFVFRYVWHECLAGCISSKTSVYLSTPIHIQYNRGLQMSFTSWYKFSQITVTSHQSKNQAPVWNMESLWSLLFV